MEKEKAKALFGIAEYIHKVWEKIPRTKILNQETTINVPESVVDYDLAVKIPPSFRSVRKPIQISAPSIVRVSASSLHPFPRTVREAIRKVEFEDGRIVYALVPKFLPPDCDLISISVSYRIDDVSILDDIVDRKKAHEPSGADKNEYWMTAQLKHPKVLVGRFGRFDLRDVDVTVDVGVYNELKTGIPPDLTRRLGIFFDIMGETDPRQQWRAIPKLRSLAKTKTVGREFEIIVDLESLFMPGKFSKYVDVIKDFRYSSCYKGRAFYELPIQIIPKKMNVISRTDLTLEKPAADGTLIYKNNLFVQAIKGIVSSSG